MCFRRSWLLLGILLIPTAVRADDHRADIYAGFAGGGGASKLFGFSEAVAVAIPKFKKVSFVPSDVSVEFGSHGDQGVTQVAYLVGARLTIAKPRLRSKVSFHALGGNVYTNDGTPDKNNGAFALGAGWEWIPTPTKPSKGLGFRVQADYIWRTGVRDDFPRFSVGAIYRFGQHEK